MTCSYSNGHRHVHLYVFKQELLTLREHMSTLSTFDWLSIAHLFNFLCCDYCFICLRSVYCVPNAASVSELSILDLPFRFL